MIPIFRESGQLLSCLKPQDLPSTLTQLKSSIIKHSIIGHQQVILINKYDQPITNDPLTDLKYAVLVQKPDTTITHEPINFYIRKPDKKGVKLSMSPYTMISQLQQMIEAKLDTPVLSQELYYGGERLEDQTETLKIVGVRQNKVVHLVDKRLIMVDLEEMYTVYLQGASHKTEAIPLEVRGKTSLGELKFKASEKLHIPHEFTVIAYCSQILQDTDVSLFSLSFINNAIIKVLDERQSVVQHFSPKQQDTFLKRKQRILQHKQQRLPLPPMQIRQAQSQIINDRDYSILNSEMADKSYAESFKVNESYLETYNRAIKASQRDSPQKELQMQVNLYFQGEEGRRASSVPMEGRELVVVEVGGQEGAGHQADVQYSKISESTQQTAITTSQLTQIPTPQQQPPTQQKKPFLTQLDENISNLRPKQPIKRTERIKQYHLKLHDLQCNVYQLIVSEIDTVRQIKLRLEQQHPILLGTPQDLLLDGKVLDNDQIAKDIFSDEDVTMFVMPRAV